MVALGVDWAPLVVKDLIEMILRLFILLTMRSTIHGTDSVVGLALARGIPLVARPSTVVEVLPVVIVVTVWETAAFLLLFVSPALHHILLIYHYFGAITPKVTVQGLDSDAALEVVDDIVVGDVGDAGSCVEKALDVAPDRLALLLLDHG